MTHEERQAQRKAVLKELKKVQKMAYSGVTCAEYDAIKTAVIIVEEFYRRDERAKELRELKIELMKAQIELKKGGAKNGK